MQRKHCPQYSVEVAISAPGRELVGKSESSRWAGGKKKKSRAHEGRTMRVQTPQLSDKCTAEHLQEVLYRRLYALKHCTGLFFLPW